MNIADYFPIWAKLGDADRRALEGAAVSRTVPAGTRIHNGSEDCVGLLVMRSGQLRAFINSPEGKEVTLSDLERLGAAEVDVLMLKRAGLVREIVKVVKVIKSGELSRAVKLTGVGATAGAKAAIEAVGGSLA